MMDLQDKGEIIARAHAIDQSHTIPYRPEYNLITGQVTASILLQQINYWWHIMKRCPFYKFRAPCKHEKYKEGDSWTEELKITVHEFDGALRIIGSKVIKGSNKAELTRTNLVLYWTDSNRMTWYQLNEKLFYTALYYAYYEPEVLAHTTIPILQNRIY